MSSNHEHEGHNHGDNDGYYSRRAEAITANYVGFEVPDEFVIGYGLDYAERYRNLPFIGILKPEVYE